MWCSRCQQDVPAYPQPAGGGNACIRCGSPLSPTVQGTRHFRLDTGREGPVAAAEARTEAMAELAGLAGSTRAKLGTTPPLLDIGPWNLEEELRDVAGGHVSWETPSLSRLAEEASKHLPHVPEVPAPKPLPIRSVRIESDHHADPIEDPKRAIVIQPRVGVARSETSAPRSGLLWLAWALLTLGLGVLVCGLSLRVSILFGAPTASADVSTALLMCGITIVVVGMVFQLEGVWDSHRQTRRILQELDARIGQPK